MDEAQRPSGVGDGRSETAAQRADRNWVDLLQEFRVLQTGVQLLSGFLLTLPFHSTFAELDDVQKGTYLALVLLAAATTATLLTPIAVHRRLFGQQRKDDLVRVGHALTRAVLVLTGALVIGTVFFVFDIVVGRGAAAIVGSFVAAAVAGALLVTAFLIGRAAEQR